MYEPNARRGDGVTKSVEYDSQCLNGLQYLTKLLLGKSNYWETETKKETKKKWRPCWWSRDRNIPGNKFISEKKYETESSLVNSVAYESKTTRYAFIIAHIFGIINDE